MMNENAVEQSIKWTSVRLARQYMARAEIVSARFPAPAQSAPTGHVLHTTPSVSVVALAFVVDSVARLVKIFL